MTSPATICLITPGHVSSTPRLVKEADTLVAAGYRVHVVAGNHHPPSAKLDATLLASARWDYTPVPARRNLAWLTRRTIRHIARPLVAAGLGSIVLAAWAHHAEALHLAALAARIPANLYIGHCLAGLPAAILAARRRQVPCGFDLEDFHEEETQAAMQDPATRAATRLLCSRLLPECRHLTAASPLIAEACRNAYGVMPIPLLNVFPLREAPECPVEPAVPGPDNPLCLYWFSQTIGPGRGLESVIDALGFMRRPVELRLRGHCDTNYRHQLEQRAASAGLRSSLVFFESAPPADMARLAAGEHLGLSVETPPPPNRNICLTNKIFTCLLAGIPVAMTPTAAQSRLASDLGEAALVLDFAGTPKAAASALDALADSPERLCAARSKAWSLSRERFNWDIEQKTFLASVAAVLS